MKPQLLRLNCLTREEKTPQALASWSLNFFATSKAKLKLMVSCLV